MPKHKLINFTSGTTTHKECRDMFFFRERGHDYRSEYHNKIKSLYNVKYALSYAGGRMALFSLLKAMGIGKGDEVIIQGYTCCAVPKAIMYTGAIPVYADITKQDYNLDYNSVRDRITDKTKAVIVQHTYGIPCEAVFKIKELCRSNNIYVIEDCAHLIKTEYHGYLLGMIGNAIWCVINSPNNYSLKLLLRYIFSKYFQITQLFSPDILWYIYSSVFRRVSE